LVEIDRQRIQLILARDEGVEHGFNCGIDPHEAPAPGGVRPHGENQVMMAGAVGIFGLDHWGGGEFQHSRSRQRRSPIGGQDNPVFPKSFVKKMDGPRRVGGCQARAETSAVRIVGFVVRRSDASPTNQQTATGSQKVGFAGCNHSPAAVSSQSALVIHTADS